MLRAQRSALAELHAHGMITDDLYGSLIVALDRDLNRDEPPIEVRSDEEPPTGEVPA
jgi:hypothetical protein